jgi:prepilin-type N-terminal cleavage/methylation domain-containing protein
MKSERGFTMVELMIALVITGFVSIVLGMIVLQTVTVPARGGEQVDAQHALQNAVYRVSLDGQTAKSASGGDTLTLTLPDNSTVIYRLIGGELHRTVSSSESIIARSISSAAFSVDGRLITMNLTAAPGKRFNVSENGTYQIAMRPAP